MQKFPMQWMLAVFVAGLLLLHESWQGLGVQADARYVGWLMANSPHAAAPAPLVLVEINDSSLEGDHAWPWSPLDYSLFLQTALPFKPAVLAMEPALDWERKKLAPEVQAKLPQYENILHNQLLSAPKVVLGARLGFQEDPDILPPMQPVPLIRHVRGNTNEIPEFTIVESQPGEPYRLAGALGFTNLPALEGGRKVPLVFRYRGAVVPSFVLQSLMLWLKLAPDEIRVVPGAFITLGDRVSVPIDATGAMWVDFQAPFQRFGCDELLLAASLQQAKQQVDLPVGDIQGSITLLARTDSAARLLRFPGGRTGSPGELIASAIATIQTQAFIRRAPIALDFGLLAAAAGFALFLAGQSKPASAAMTALILIAYLLCSLMIFGAIRLWIPFFMPASLLGFTLLMRLAGPSAEKQE
jgi:hypothetical protein